MRLINAEELLAIHRAKEPSRSRLFAAWLQQRGRQAMRTTLRRVADRRGQGWLLNDPGFIEDAMCWASFVAWQAIVGFRWFCPHCLEPDVRYGQKRSTSFATERGLRLHLAFTHDERECKMPASGIVRRVHYMIGSALQKAVRTRARYVVRYQGAARYGFDDPLFRPTNEAVPVFMASKPLAQDSIEFEDRTALHLLAEVEIRLDRERLAARLDSQIRYGAALLLSGLSIEKATELCSALGDRDLIMHRRCSDGDSE